MMNNGFSFSSFVNSYNRQISFQEKVTGVKCPGDNVKQYVYQFGAMTEELGEIAKADKRWKTHRNTTFDPDEKLDEIADMFIVAMNFAIHSGYSSETIETAICHKIGINLRRLEESRHVGNN